MLQFIKLLSSTNIRKCVNTSYFMQYKRFASSDSSLGRIFASDGDKQQSITSVEIINEASDSILFDGFNPAGFKLSNGTKIIGPCAAFPKTILFWNVKSADDINETSLSLFTALEPKLDCLVIGKGHSKVKVDVLKIKSYLKTFHINVEILPSVQAIGMFNFLNSEERCVAAALIPPDYEDMYEEEKDEIVKKRLQRTELIQDDGLEDDIDIELPPMPLFPTVGPPPHHKGGGK